jgi:hypothetical protein
MTLTSSVKVMIFLWKIGIVDSLTLAQFLMNATAQYGGVVVAQSVGVGTSRNILHNLLGPVKRLVTASTFIRRSSNVIERGKRISMVAAALSMSASILEADPATNSSFGATIAGFINYMEVHNGNNGLVFLNPIIFGRLSKTEFYFLNISLSGVFLVLVFLPKILKAYYCFSKFLANYILRKSNLSNFPERFGISSKSKSHRLLLHIEQHHPSLQFYEALLE